MMRDKMSRAVRKVLESRGYDNYPADEELFTEAVDEITDAVMRVVKAL